MGFASSFRGKVMLSSAPGTAVISPLLWHDLGKLHPWLIYGVEISLLLLAFLSVRLIVVRWLRGWALRHRMRHRSAMVEVVAQGLTPILLVGLLEAAFNLLDLPAIALSRVNRAMNVSILILALFFLSRLLQILVARWMTSAEGATDNSESVQYFTKFIFGAVATLVVLENLHVELKTVWTTLGIGGVAVALALQDTLSNFFAGFYLRLDKPVELGDYVLLEGSQEGFIRELGWRSTRMRTLSNNLVVIPNTKLASTVLINYSAPVSENSLLVDIKVKEGPDPEQVKNILMDEARLATREIVGLDPDFQPRARFVPKTGEPLQDYAIISRVVNGSHQFALTRQLRDRLSSRLEREGIEVSVPEHRTDDNVREP
jgi:small-conductance mechanosensitive channel